MNYTLNSRPLKKPRNTPFIDLVDDEEPIDSPIQICLDDDEPGDGAIIIIDDDDEEPGSQEEDDDEPVIVKECPGRNAASLNSCSEMLFFFEKNKKRKRKFDGSVSLSGENYSSGTKPPWVRDGYGYGTTLSGLNDEIRDFVKYISPTELEEEMRSIVLDRITTAIKSLWPFAKVDIFGSFQSGLYLPTSDIDIVINGRFNDKNPLHHLSSFLKRQKNQFSEVNLISARVPIIKVVDTESNILIDISCNSNNGIQNTKIVKDYLREFEQLRSLVLVIKYFLLQRKLNSTNSGGLGGYALTLMIVHFLQGFIRKSPPDKVNNLGFLLVEFFHHYGCVFDYRKSVVVCNHQGNSYLKSDKKWAKQDSLLCIEDPQCEGNDVGRNSTKIIPYIQQSFEYAYMRLTGKLSSEYLPTLLSRILYKDGDLIAMRSNTQRICSEIREQLERSKDETALPSPCPDWE